MPGYFENMQIPDGSTEDSTGTITEEPKEDFETDAASEDTVFTDSQGITYDLDGDACSVSGYTKDIKSSVSIPEELNTGDHTYTVKGIQKQAFLNCRNMEKIKLPNSLNEIPKGTFSECRNFTSLTIVPVKYSIYKNGNTSFAKIRVNSVLFGEAENVRLEIPKTLVTELAAQKSNRYHCHLSTGSQKQRQRTLRGAAASHLRRGCCQRTFQMRQIAESKAAGHRRQKT